MKLQTGQLHAHPEDREKLASYPLFDWLRFGLASVVALGHAGMIQWSESGNLAVQIFFALSGWLIGGILLESEVGSLPRFYFNRVTRIWLPYFFAVFLLYTVSALRDPITFRWLQFLIYDLTFTHNWFSLLPDVTTALSQMPLSGTGNHFWSIAVEEQFYLVTPGLVFMTRLGRVPIFWAITSLALIAIHQTDFASIAAGVCAASVRRQFGDWHMSRHATILLICLAASSGAALSFQVAYYYVVPLFSIAVVLLAARPGSRGGIGKFLGGVSYPMYLNHWIGAFVAHAIVKQLPISAGFVGFLAYGGGVVAGIVAYLAIDRAVMAKRNSWYSRAIGLCAASLAYALLIFGLLYGSAINWVANLT